MVKEIILIILLFNGEVKLPSFAFKGNMHECFQYGDKLREALSYHTWEYIPGDPMSHGWFLKDGTGTFQGFICK
jgi:hypothetical protein|tara:strand:- start:614 stop:835 length:222 start_codon:yes stop_codon:yes gene_type:complete